MSRIAAGCTPLPEVARVVEMLADCGIFATLVRAGRLYRAECYHAGNTYVVTAACGTRAMQELAAMCGWVSR